MLARYITQLLFFIFLGEDNWIFFITQNQNSVSFSCLTFIAGKDDSKKREQYSIWIQRRNKKNSPRKHSEPFSPPDSTRIIMWTLSCFVMLWIWVDVVNFYSNFTWTTLSPLPEKENHGNRKGIWMPRGEWRTFLPQCRALFTGRTERTYLFEFRKAFGEEAAMVSIEVVSCCTCSEETNQRFNAQTRLLSGISALIAISSQSRNFTSKYPELSINFKWLKCIIHSVERLTLAWTLVSYIIGMFSETFDYLWLSEKLL